MSLYPCMLDPRQYKWSANIFRTAFDYHLESFSSPSDFIENETNTMSLEHIVILADFLLKLDELEEAVVVIKRGQRWLDGRMNEKHWDGFEDDREYDPPGFSREGVKREPDEEDEDGEEGAKRGNGLEVDLRQKLALTRLKLGHDKEASVSLVTCLLKSGRC